MTLQFFLRPTVAHSSSTKSGAVTMIPVLLPHAECVRSEVCSEDPAHFLSSPPKPPQAAPSSDEPSELRRRKSLKKEKARWRSINGFVNLNALWILCILCILCILSILVLILILIFGRSIASIASIARPFHSFTHSSAFIGAGLELGLDGFG
ncbi:hypothetical protein B0H34DRAFT_65091 [Crassisporium funariophilum]|nr:hypothetical protein B0H34DRAFT_65091 [Crassisporium funariophilum]